MRRSAIIGMAAFYLFLTTGMFVCTIHCMADYIANENQIPQTESCSHHTAKKKDKTDCCNQHANYIVKENISEIFGIKVPSNSFIFILSPGFTSEFSNQAFASRVQLPQGHPPPGISGSPIFIKIHTLLI